MGRESDDDCGIHRTRAPVCFGAIRWRGGTLREIQHLLRDMVVMRVKMTGVDMHRRRQG